MRQFALFCISGVLAFVVDAGLTQAWVSFAGLDPWSGRALSFPVAVTCTWLFNRRFTFVSASPSPLFSQWMVYVGTQLAGASINLGTYALLALLPLVARWPVLGVAAGSLAGLVANYFGAKHVAFADRR